MLQWGRPPMRAETRDRDREHGRLEVASMGPPSDEGGNRERPTGRSARSRASMGPPSDEGGNHRRHDHPPLPAQASMGPPSDEGGNPPAPVSMAFLTPLQWGRPPMRAETSMYLACASVTAWPLQWGRPPMRAETRRNFGGPDGRTHASMGPPSDEGGNSLAEKEREAAVGRASMGPPSDEGGN